MIKELIKLATHLDERGLAKEADYLDSVIKKIAADRNYKYAMDELGSNSKGYSLELDMAGFEEDVDNVAHWIGHLQNSGHLNVDPTISETIRNISIEIVRALSENQKRRREQHLGGQTEYDDLSIE